ncbi:MAG: LTA synthase family protein [Arcticibacter sp.]
MQSILKRWLPVSVRYLLAVVFFSTIIFALLRGSFILFNGRGEIGSDGTLLYNTFLLGWKFDMVVLSYLLALPILIFLFHYLLQSKSKVPTKTISYLVSAGMAISCFAAIADIPYFDFFKNRLTEDALQWMGTPGTVLHMIASNYSHLFFLILAILLCLLTGWFFHTIAKRMIVDVDWRLEFKRVGKPAALAVFLVSGFICFLGMRGKLTHPIRPGDAFHCENAFLNQATLNPVFTFMKSFSYKVNLMDDEEAIAKTRNFLGLPQLQLMKGENPFHRNVNASVIQPNKPNVVLVLMEGMGAGFMGVFGNGKGMTPELDNLAKKSLLFENAYSAGIHTNNGVFTTLYSYPALKRIRPMSTVPTRKFTGLPYALKEQGYWNYFFCSHNREFDNLGNFIPANHFDQLYTQEDFPASASIGPYGVPDGYLFDRLLMHLDTITAKGPVFTTVLTASNHDPYVIPSDFESVFSNKEYDAIHYADHAIGKFMVEAAQKLWYANTVFVFVADHGRVYGDEPYDLQQSFSHIPIIIHYPKQIQPMRDARFIGQVDVFPTLMGILGLGYENNTLGVDVMKKPRPAVYFSQDDKLGCINGQWLYVYRFGGKETLYNYREGSSFDHASKQPEEMKLLRDYALSQTQSAAYVISSNLTSPRK